MAEQLKIIPLGGLNEIGKNMTAYEYGGEIIVVDCGMAFPGDDMYGIDCVIPDVSYLVKNRSRLRGLFITHGHEDHIGAIPYVLKQINMPIYCTRFTAGLIKLKLQEHGLASSTKLITVEPGQTVRAGKFQVEFIHVNHSIADSVAFAIHTRMGAVVHTGDFKIDSTPIDGEVIDLARFGELGKQGVLALLAALRLGSGVEGSWNEALWNWAPAPWLFRFDYLKYLCIIIPGTIAGDRIYEWMTQSGEDAPGASRRREVWILVLLVTLICLNMWGLFARQLVVNLAAGVLICLLLRRLLRGDGSATGRLHGSLFGWGFFWLMLGLALEAFEGGIKKDYATFSYFFVTSGLASFVLIAAGIAMRRLNVRFSALVKCGQNPMVAYTAAGFLIMPLLTLLHLAPYLQTFAELCPWMGVVRGVLVTAAVMAVTVFFTNRRLFWRT